MTSRSLQAPHVAIRLAAYLVIGFLVIPTLVVVPLSFNGGRYLEFPPKSLSLRWYENFFHTASWVQSTELSFFIAVCVMIIAVVLGTGAAIALHRFKFRGKGLLFGFLISPLMIPVVVLALALYLYFSKLDLVATWFGIIFGQTILAIPFVLVNVYASLQNYPLTLERAASTLGAGSGTIFRRIMLPLIRPGVLAGALFAFMISFDEVVIALFLSGPGVSTLPVKMWHSLRFSVSPTIAAVSTMITTLSVSLFLIGDFLHRRSLAKRNRPVSAENEAVEAEYEMPVPE